MQSPLPGNAVESNAQLLQGYLSEEEYARQRGVTLRTCQRDRALRQAPPYVKFYSVRNMVRVTCSYRLQPGYGVTFFMFSPLVLDYLF